MSAENSITVAIGDQPLRLPLSVANRHGLIAGATGTGKTVTLRTLAEGFARAGVPVFLADVKGDLGGLGFPGGENPKVVERARSMGINDWRPEAPQVIFWDVFGEQGHPLRATISDMGPHLIGRILELNDTQESVLSLAFRVADDQGLLLLDLPDLRAMMNHVGQSAKSLSLEYGAVAAASVAAIQRGLLEMDSQGAGKFFGEPALLIQDLMRPGTINVLAADRLIHSPRLYGSVLLWLLAELYQTLPEVGDRDRPSMVFFFDEAHLLFNDAPRALIEQVEQVIRLIRSKGVGIYFVTQSPLDVPDTVLGQLGHRVQHALRAFTPRDQKAVKAVADSFRPNPKLDTGRTVQELAVGEALVSLLDEQGVPAVVQRARVVPPRSRLAPIDPTERRQLMSISPVTGRYDRMIDRDSAREELLRRAQGQMASGEDARAQQQQQQQYQQQQPQQPGAMDSIMNVGGDMVKMLGKDLVRKVSSQLGREIVRGVMGMILKR